LQHVNESGERAIEPFRIERAEGRGAFILVCDHASNTIPPAWGDLGLGEADRERHIAWDPGALPVAQRLSALLDAPLFHAEVSRLLLDMNRAPGSPTLIVEESEGTPVPGNRAISAEERERRLELFYYPYHAALSQLVESHAERRPALVAVHSFTPVYHGETRPWALGVLFDEDRVLADHLLAELAKPGDKLVAANEPYAPKDGVYWTMESHGARRGLHSVMLEISSAEIESEAQQQDWAERLAAALGTFAPERA
jgi:predicted N-formylglutamate amidohydrolase